MPNRKEAHSRKPPAGGTGLSWLTRAPLAALGNLTALPPAALALVAAAFAGILYLPSLQFGGVWDDTLLVATKGAGGAAAEGFRPLLRLIQQGEWALGAGNPSLFHLTNLLFHMLGAWLCFRLALHLGAGAGTTFFVALLFGAHPVHVESVAYISGRGAMMAAVFGLGALLAARTPTLCSPEGCRSKTIYVAYALFAAALFTHESAMIVPFILLVLDRLGPTPIPFRQRRVHYSGFLAIAFVAALLIFTNGSPSTPSAERGVPSGLEIVALLHSAADYLRVLFWPWPLNAIRSLAPDSTAGAAAGVLAMGVAAVAAFVWWRREDAMARVGAAVLTLGVLAVLPYPKLWNPYAAERLAYFASAGAVLLVGSLFQRLRGPIGRHGGPRVAATAGGILLLTVVTSATLDRTPVWRDNVALLHSAAAASPHDPEPYLQLAAHYAAANDAERSLQALEQAIERDGTRVEAHSRKALILGTMGRWSEAEAAARRATELNPRGAEGWANLGDALAQQGKSVEGAVASRRAVELDSTQAAIWYNYGVSLAATGDGVGAASAYRRALAIDSTHVGAWNNLGALHGGQGQLAEARLAYEKAVELAPNSIQARMNLALAYLRSGDRERAAEQRNVIQRMDPAAARQLLEFFAEVDSKTPAR